MSSALTKGQKFVALAYKILQVVLCFIVCFLLVFFLSLLKQPVQVHNNFFYAVPREAAELGICTFCKAVLYGNCKQYILSIVCANESLSGSSTLSVFLA